MGDASTCMRGGCLGNGFHKELRNAIDTSDPSILCGILENQAAEEDGQFLPGSTKDLVYEHIMKDLARLEIRDNEGRVFFYGNEQLGDNCNGATCGSKYRLFCSRHMWKIMSLISVVVVGFVVFISLVLRIPNSNGATNLEQYSVTSYGTPTNDGWNSSTARYEEYVDTTVNGSIGRMMTTTPEVTTHQDETGSEVQCPLPEDELKGIQLSENVVGHSSRGSRGYNTRVLQLSPSSNIIQYRSGDGSCEFSSGKIDVLNNTMVLLGLRSDSKSTRILNIHAESVTKIAKVITFPKLEILRVQVPLSECDTFFKNFKFPNLEKFIFEANIGNLTDGIDVFRGQFFQKLVHAELSFSNTGTRVLGDAEIIKSVGNIVASLDKAAPNLENVDIAVHIPVWKVENLKGSLLRLVPNLNMNYSYVQTG